MTLKQLLLIASLLLAPLNLLGQQDQTPTPEPQPQPQPQAGQPPGVVDEQSEGKPETGDPAVQESAANSQPIKDFKPTDTIGADSAVAFPVDI